MQNTQWRAGMLGFLLCVVLCLGIASQTAAKAGASDAAYPLPAGAKIILQLGHAADGLSFVFSPDQRFILSAGGDQTIKLWDIASGTLLRSFEEREASTVDEALFSPDGQRVVSAGANGLHLWSASSGDLLLTMGGPSQYSLASHARAVAFSPDGRYLVAGYRDHNLRLWDSETGALLRTFEGHREEVGSVAFYPDGQLIVSASRIGLQDVAVRLWDARSGATIRQFRADDSTTVSAGYHAFMGEALRVSADGKYLFARSIDSKCTIWNIQSGAVVKRFTAAAMSPDWRRLAVPAGGEGVEIRDADTGARIGSGSFPGAAKFSPDGRVIGSIGEHYAISLWSIEDGGSLRVLPPRQEPLRAVAFAGDGRRVVTGNDAGLQIWDEARLIRSLPSDSPIRSLAWAPDGNVVLAGAADRTMRLWSAASGEVIRQFKLSGVRENVEDVTSASFGNDGNTVLGANATTTQLFDTGTGAAIRTFGGAFSAAFSGDGRWVATGGNNAAVWDIETGAVVRKLDVPGPATHAVSFSSSGNVVALGTDGLSVRLWDSRSGTLLRTLNGHRGNVRVVAFSPDSRTLLSGGFENTLRLWRVADGTMLRDFRGHQGWIAGVSFNSQGSRFVSAGYDGTWRLWDTNTGRLVITTVVRNGHWLSVTPQGLFVASGDPQEFLRIVRGFDVLPMEEFIARNRRDSLGQLFADVK